MIEARGAVHVHTAHSDGFWPADRVIGAASRAGVQFLVITDHDTLAAATEPGAGWHGDVLVIVGTEVSPPQNHYLAFGLDQSPDPRQPAGDYVREVTDAGGFGFAAHPFDRGNKVIRVHAYPWTAGHDVPFEGLEIWNLSSHLISAASSLPRLLLALAAPGIYLRGPDPQVLALWDRLGESRPVPGLGGVDAHGFPGWLGRSGALLLDYRAMFRTLQTRVLLDRPLTGDAEADTAAVLGALRRGQCYICNARLGDPAGFWFAARQQGRSFPMGSELPLQPGMQLEASLPRPARLRLLRNGQVVADSWAGRQAWPVSSPGVYRLEAWRRGWWDEQVWVLSNPVYIR